MFDDRNSSYAEADLEANDKQNLIIIGWYLLGLPCMWVFCCSQSSFMNGEAFCSFMIFWMSALISDATGDDFLSSSSCICLTISFLSFLSCFNASSTLLGFVTDNGAFFLAGVLISSSFLFVDFSSLLSKRPHCFQQLP